MAGSGYLPREADGRVLPEEWKCYHCNEIVGPEMYRTDSGHTEDPGYSVWAACKKCGDAHGYTKLPRKWTDQQLIFTGGLYR